MANIQYATGKRVGKGIKAFFVFLVFFSIDFFNYRPFVENLNLALLRQLFGSLLLLFGVNILLSFKTLFFRREYFLILLSFALCGISSFILYGQGFYESFKATMSYVYGLSLYLVAVRYNIDERFIYRLLFATALIMGLIEIFQQFTYPTYWFCGRIEKEWQNTLEIRMGVYRFTLYGILFCVLSLLLIFQRILTDKKSRLTNLILFAVVFVAIIFDVERKILFSSITVMVLGVLFAKGKLTGGKIVLVCLIVLIVYGLSQLMGDLNEQTTDELGDSDFIRFLSMYYYLFEFDSSPLYYLFGAGFPGESALGDKVNYLEEMYGYFQADVGLVGYISKTGIFGLFAYVLIAYKILCNHRFLDLSLILFLIVLLILCIFNFCGNYYPNIAAFSLYLYLIECNIRQNKFNKSHNTTK